MKEMLKKLSETDGISGFEGNVKELLREEMEKHADVKEDELGNLIAKKGEGEPTLMLTAHMDQIGLAVKYIDENGFIRFTGVGGIDDRTLINQRVNVHSSKGVIKGVISSKPTHLLEEEERKKSIKKDKLFIDVGADDQEDVEEMGIEVGNQISFDRNFSELGKENVVTGQAFDDRVGCLLLLEALKRFDGDYTLYTVATVQEEVGLKGARTAAFRVDPDVAVSVDTGIAGDLPGIEKQEATLEMGEGPALGLIESEGRGLITTPLVRKWLKKTAEDSDIDYQVSVSEGGMTEGAIMYITKEGIPSGTISIPTRNIHSCVEVLDMDDVKKAGDWLEAAFKTFKDYSE
ncbi:MAG: M42 family metallopeptidase [Candidatus Aenigmatarchaeota archaeon]